ncbi:hypothetical protein ACLB6C_06845 [Enterobacter hormaechei]
MADILLKYLTDLPAATEANNEDLMHINQGGNDKSITISSLHFIDGKWRLSARNYHLV